MTIYLYLNSAIQAAAFAVALLLVLGIDPPARAVRIIGALGIALLLVALCGAFSSLAIDFKIFRGVGREVLSGVDPYGPAGAFDPIFVNPPTALPVLALLALLPERAGLVVFPALNALAIAALPALAVRVLRGQSAAFDPPRSSRPWSEALTGGVVLGLTVALLTSESAFISLVLGQLSILEAVVLLAALDAQARGRPVLAGLWLAIGTVKVATMLPFLLLFLRRGDLRAWAALIGGCALLIGVTGQATHLPASLETMLRRIGRLAAPGEVNDFSLEGNQNFSIVGFDHALYRLGLRDRRAAQWGQYLAVLATGGWVAWKVGAGRLQRGAACSLVALYSMLFLYHRGYDAIVLVLPLVYLTAQARAAAGGRRWAFRGGAVAVLFMLFLKPASLDWIAGQSFGWGVWGRLAQAVVLPYGTWASLLAMALLVWGESDGWSGEARPDVAA